MGIDKKSFLKDLVILYDTREQKNQHILTVLENKGVATEKRKLDFGDYSFMAGGRDFSLSCVIERKANVDEIYNNIIAERGRIEKELYAASQLSRQMTLLLENVGGWEELMDYTVPAWQMASQPQRKQREIGRITYATLRAWKVGNRYNFNVEFVKDTTKTADKMLETFYYYWRTFKELTGARKE